MFELKKWEPLRELSNIQREMDELFRRTFGSLTSGLFRIGAEGEWIPSIDCFVKDNRFILRADLPGVDPKDVDISVTGNMLTIKGERKAEVEEKKGEYFYHETGYGRFERSLTLPEGVDTSDIHATYRNGVLEVTMPVKAEALPRKVHIELEEGEKAEKAA